VDVFKLKLPPLGSPIFLQACVCTGLGVMDDCNLKSLKVKPGQLSPVFKPDTIEYKATVGSKVTTIVILYETSDRNATVTILVSISLAP